MYDGVCVLDVRTFRPAAAALFSLSPRARVCRAVLLVPLLRELLASWVNPSLRRRPPRAALGAANRRRPHSAGKGQENGEVRVRGAHYISPSSLLYKIIISRALRHNSLRYLNKANSLIAPLSFVVECVCLVCVSVFWCFAVLYRLCCCRVCCVRVTC